MDINLGFSNIENAYNYPFIKYQNVI
jgi:hypothetical protein